MDKKWDFAGWATRHNVVCSDGRTIMDSAFKDNDNLTVPLVWNHNHSDIDNVLGHALLEYRHEGVYAYGTFNKTERGLKAKEAVRNNDLTALSIYANKLQQVNKNVVHGTIREVSLVLAGANPGAVIETVLAHGDSQDNGECALIWNNNETLELPNNEIKDISHADETEKATVENTNKKPEGDNMENSKDETVNDVFETLTEKQKNMVYALLTLVKEDNDNNNDDKEDGGNENMKHNAFDSTNEDDVNVISHSDLVETFNDARSNANGSLKDAALSHGITNVEALFPEAQGLNGAPEAIARDMAWVSKVMSGVSKSPFSRVKSTAANMTAEAARAKGYIKGNQKVESVITALKRVTTPTTVYKLQKIDRDDILDITDFDVVVFMKGEMRVALNEELARAYLIGDGRSSSSDDKINPINIRPIYGDDPVYAVSRVIAPEAGATAGVKAKMFIQEIVRSRKLYKGSGNPTLFTTEDQLVEMLLLEDANERVIYDSVNKLQTALRVSDIVTVPVMDGISRTADLKQFDLIGILVNLSDYSVGADKGGAVTLFDDFDLNFNKQEYLIETRCSAALKKPYSAIVFESKGEIVEG